MAYLQELKTKISDALRSPIARPIHTIVDKGDQFERERKAHFQKLWDFFIGDQDEIKHHIANNMTGLFKPATMDRMIVPYVNLARKIVRRLCNVYQIPAVRYIVEEGRARDNYQECLGLSDINIKAKLWHEMARMLDTVYVQPVFRRDHIEYDLFPPHLLNVEEDPDNYLLPRKVWYERQVGDENLTYIWTAEEHWVLDEGKKPKAGMNEWEGVNRYGVLPLVPLRLRETENHWGEGDSQLVDMMLKANILLTSAYYNAIMQSHGQPFAVNCNLGEDIKLGPDWIVQANNVTGDDVPPSFQFVQPSPAVKENIDAIDWMFKMTAVSKGLPASSVSIDATAESGVSKLIDNWELMELRQNDVEFLRLFEKRLFAVTVAVWNYHSPGKKIDPNATFGVDFIEPTKPVDQKAEDEHKDWLLKHGLWTPVDDMIDEDEGIDEERALDYIRHNLEIKKELSDMKTPEQLQDAVGFSMDKTEEDEEAEDADTGEIRL